MKKWAQWAPSDPKIDEALKTTVKMFQKKLIEAKKAKELTESPKENKDVQTKNI